MSTEVTSDKISTERPRGGRTKRVYQCRHCQRNFKRSEHCSRHERVHTQERPFPCSFCERRYARKDLVKRHERSLHEEAYQAAHPEEFRQRSLQLIDQNHPAGFGEPSTYETHDSTASSGTARTPLTPPNEVIYLDPNSHSAPDELFRVDQPFAHDFQSPLRQFSPPSSLHEQERRASLLMTFADNYSQPNGYAPNDDDFCPLELWGDHTPHPSQPNVAYLDSSAKRRRIEIDPFLLIDDNVQSPQLLHTELSPHGSFAPPPPNNFSLFSNDHVCYPHLQAMSVADMSSLPQAAYPSFQGSNKFFSPENVPQSTQQIPRVQKEGHCELPDFKFNETIRKKIYEDARTRLPTGELVEALFPTVDDLNYFFSGYMQCFHRHFPILHLWSLDVKETPSPLVFAICSIGAQYRLSRQKAKNLFALAGTMSSYALRAGLPIVEGTPKPGPLWVMQTRVLLSLCGMFSGKTNVVMRTVENLGLFAIDYRLRVSLLNLDVEKKLDWEEWISRESSKRLVCGMFIVSNLISTTFGINAGFSHTHDLEFEVLDSESLWNTQSAEKWMKVRNTLLPNRRTVRQTMERMIFSGQSTEIEPPASVQVSSLTMLLMMHAVNIHMSNLLQITNTLNCPTSSHIYETITESAFSTLSRCEKIIASARGSEIHGITTWGAEEGPLMFNCQGLLRIAYIRLFSTTNAFDRLTLLSDNPQDIATAVRNYAQSPQKRNENLMRSVKKAFEMLLATVKIGYLLLRKTAALSWSIEHAIAGWDAALFLTKWVHAIEVEGLLVPPDTGESLILDGLRDLLTEVGSNYSGIGSLAAQLAHFSSSTLNDCWVWGVTPRMGNILQQLAIAYEKDYRDLVSMESGEQ